MKAKRPSPFCLRLSQAERARLERDAAGWSLGAYIRMRLFDPAVPPPKTRGKFPVKDHAALGRLIALLGQSRLANNLNQLARAANTGSLILTPDIEAELHAAFEDISEMRRLLLDALGQRGGP